MALSDDECDIEALSALLEEDSCDGHFVASDSVHAEGTHTSVISPERGSTALHLQPEKELLESLFNKDADFEDDGDMKNSHKESSADSNKDHEHVTMLQDELAMMQKRMMEIQRLLVSQTLSSTSQPTVLSPCENLQTVPNSTKRTVNDAKNRMSLSMSSKSSSSSLTPPRTSDGIADPARHEQSCRYNASSSLSLSNVCADTADGQWVKGCLSVPGSSHSHKEFKQEERRSSMEKTSKHMAKEDNASNPISSSNTDMRKIAGQKDTKNILGAKAAIQKVNIMAKSRSLEEFSGNSGIKDNSPSQDSTFLMDLAEKDGHREESSVASLTQKLFGDADSDSDWEDLDGEKTSLSSAGKEISKLLKQGERQRQAHTPSYTANTNSSYATWKAKPEAKMTGEVKTSISTKKEADDCSTERFSGLRIINPKISSVMLATKMEGRKMVAVSKLPQKVKSVDLQGDWVTIGALVYKSDARKSQTGKTYSIWKLSDLQDLDVTVSFFLFGEVYKQLWKTEVCTVIGLLNPNIMDPLEKSPGEVAITVNKAAQMLEIGQSKDLGWCIGKTKKGTTCNNIINKKFGDFCTYHVQAAYRKQAAKRGELHGSCPGTAPKNNLKNKLLQNGMFFYGGETYTAQKVKSTNLQSKVTLAKLQGQLTTKDTHKISTLSLQNLLPGEFPKLTKSMASEQEQPFLDALSVPSAGSMNLIRHLAKSEGHKNAVLSSGKGMMNNTFQSVLASDLIKQHKEEMAVKISQRKQLQQSQQKSPAARSGSSSRSPNESKKLEKDSCLSGSSRQLPNDSKKLEKDSRLSGSSRQLPNDSRKLEKDSRLSGIGRGDKVTIASPGSSVPAKTTVLAKLDAAPVLGKGFYPGSKIDLFLDDSCTAAKQKANGSDIAKRKAIEKVKAKGGLEKVDPNAVRKCSTNPEVIRKRVLENFENENGKESNDSSIGKQIGDRSAEPPKKRSRLLGNVDPNSDEVKKLLGARSSHMGALAQAEADREDRYFDGLEKKEKMEEKMMSVTSIEVTCFTCKQCKYTAASVLDRCKQEHHEVKKHRGKRRFFACKKCKHRTVTLHRYPNSPCKKCGSNSFEKTSMHKEKAGPKLDNETLCLRGDESKCIGSMDQKVYLTTFEQP